MMMNKRAFSLVEMAIVLVIFGVILTAASSILTLFVNKGEAERTRSMMESDKSAMYSYVSTNRRLPTAADFTTSATYPLDGYNRSFYYYADPVLDKSDTAIWPVGGLLDVNSVCGSSATNTRVRICTTAACTAAADYTEIQNIALVIVSGSENKNIQTFHTTISGNEIFKVYPQGMNGRDDYATDGTRTEPFDDIVDWVTLDELRTKSGCDSEQFKFLSMSLPPMLQSTAYQFDFYIEGGIPHKSANDATAEAEYYWAVNSSIGTGVITDQGLAFTVIGADGTPQNLTANGTSVVRGVSLRLSGTPASISAGQFAFRVFVYDEAISNRFPAATVLNNAYTKVFSVSAQFASP